MIELLILEHLQKELAPFPAYLEEPANAPAKYVLLEKTGSSKENRLCSSTFIFQSYADSLYNAAVLNELVKEKVESLIYLDEIGRIKLNSDYNYTDTETKKYRYQAVYDINHY